MNQNFTSKRFISSLLLSALILTLFSCGASNGSDNSQVNESSDALSVSSDEDTSDGKRASDDIPETDLKGRTFNFLVREEVSYEFSTEQDGEYVNDAVYGRNRYIEERFNCKLNYVLEPGL